MLGGGALLKDAFDVDSSLEEEEGEIGLEKANDERTAAKEVVDPAQIELQEELPELVVAQNVAN